MRAIVLAAGYATRLHPLTLERPKPLLPVGGKPILEHLLENLLRVKDLEDIALVTNRKFFGMFQDWARGRDLGVPLEILDDGTVSNEERLGAIGDLRLAWEALGSRGDFLVVAGDNLFPFEFQDLAGFFRAKGADAVTCYLQPDPRRLRRTGVAVLGGDGRVLDFAEKPAEPASPWAVPPLYAYAGSTLKELKTYLEEGNPPDAPGHFLAWLCRRKPVFALQCSEGPLDIGTAESFLEADRLWSAKAGDGRGEDRPLPGPAGPPRLARLEYGRALEIQRRLVGRRAAGELPDLVWYLEHEPVVTWGSKGGLDHLKLPVQEIAARGIALFETDRGGDITYHGPGQLVGYPIVSLGEDRDLHRYLRRIEEAIIGAVGEHGLEGRRVEGRTGVWVGGSKIAAIGVRVSRWIASHGFSLNVDCDLAGFDAIVPCGISDAGVTSMARELERAGRRCPAVEDVVPAVHRSLEKVLERPLRKVLEVP